MSFEHFVKLLARFGHKFPRTNSRVRRCSTRFCGSIVCQNWARFRDQANDELILEETANGILLRPAVSVPIDLYTEECIAEFSKDNKALGKKLAHS